MSGTVHTVTLNGREFDLRYDYAFSARAIRNLAPIGQKRELLDIVMSSQIEDEVVCLAAGIREVHDRAPKQAMAGIRNFIEDIFRWVDDARESERDIETEIWLPMRRAIGESGITGRRFTIEDDMQIKMLDGILGKAAGGTVKAAE